MTTTMEKAMATIICAALALVAALAFVFAFAPAEGNFASPATEIAAQAVPNAVSVAASATPAVPNTTV